MRETSVEIKSSFSLLPDRNPPLIKSIFILFFRFFLFFSHPKGTKKGYLLRPNVKKDSSPVQKNFYIERKGREGERKGGGEKILNIKK